MPSSSVRVKPGVALPSRNSPRRPIVPVNVTIITEDVVNAAIFDDEDKDTGYRSCL